MPFHLLQRSLSSPFSITVFPTIRRCLHTMQLKRHQSALLFDYAQQVYFLSDPLQPDPFIFLLHESVRCLGSAVRQYHFRSSLSQTSRESVAKGLTL